MTRVTEHLLIFQYNHVVQKLDKSESNSIMCSHIIIMSTHQQLPVSAIYHTYSDEEKDEIQLYLSQLTEIEQQAYCIAVEHLGTSYNVRKSNGFIKWQKSRSQ